MTTTRDARVTAAVVLLWVGWVLVPLVLGVMALGTGLTFLGEQPTAAETAQAGRLLVAAAVALVAVPLLGIAFGLWHGRRVSAASSAGALVVGLLLSAPVLGGLSSGPSSTVPRDGGGACQEHSGGDTRCPGG